VIVAQFFCRVCDGPNEFTHDNGKSRLYPVPEDACVYCGSSGKWRTGTDPKKEYALSENDRRFLRSLRIACEDASE
jgi:hypothetical protein